MQLKLRDKFASLPKLFWEIVAVAFTIYSVLRDSVLKELTPEGSLAIVTASVVMAAIAAIVILSLRVTDKEKVESGLQHYARSIEEFDSGNYGEALKEALEAVKDDPTRPVHWNRVGRTALRLGELDLAIQHFTKAIELDKSRENRSNHLHNRGIAFYMKGNYRRAQTDMLDSLAISPRSVVTLYHLSVNALAMGDTEAACSYANRSVSIDRPAALAVESAALVAAGRKDLAEEKLARCLATDVRTAADHYYIAAAHAALGNLSACWAELHLSFQKDVKYKEWFIHDPLFRAYGDRSEREILAQSIQEKQ